jgi:hypothetical protein
MSQELAQTEEGEVALAFATKLVAGDFAGAFELFASSLQQSTSPNNLREQFDSMISYTDRQVSGIDVLDIEHEYWWMQPSNWVLPIRRSTAKISVRPLPLLFPAKKDGM